MRWVGLAGAGLAVLLSARESEPGAPLAAVDAWRRPRARWREAIGAAEHARCGIDLSDGLSMDAAHLAEASGVSIVLDEQAVVSGELASAARWLDGDPLALALSGGEDYALLVAAPPTVELDGFECIGRVEPRGGSLLWLNRGGGLEPLEPRGFDHFR